MSTPTPKQEEHPNPWAEYERRKAELDQQGLSPAEYFNACKRIAEELGI